MSVNSFYGFGRRKEAGAKVFLSEGTGKIRLFTGNRKNKKERDMDLYFSNNFLIEDFLYPLVLIGKKGDFDIDIWCGGGGITAQAGAIKLALAKALLAYDPAIKEAFKTYKFLTQDRRFKERKKVGKRGARRSPQFTKR